MSIRARLFLIVSGSLLLISGAIAVYFIIMQPVNRLGDEERVISLLVQNINSLQTEIDKFMVEDLSSQRDRYREASASFDAVFEDFSKVRVLPTINQDMADAVSGVINLKNFNEGYIMRVLDEVNSLIEGSPGILGDGEAVAALALYQAGARPGASAEARGLSARVETLAQAIKDANSGFAIMNNGINQKDEFIRATVDRLRSRSSLLALVMLILVILLSVALSLMLVQSISRSIIRLRKFMDQVALGDFSKRSGSHGRDEIAVFALNLDGLLDTLCVSIGSIQSVSKENLGLRDNLLSSVERATSSSTHIRAHSESIRGQMERMDGMIGKSSKEEDSVLSVMKGFSTLVFSQSERVSESLNAVERMLASLASMAKSTSANQAASESLVAEADTGREVFQQSFAKITEITELMSAIQDMASAIDGVSGQTNILAMNAAIEAAHAGEYGRGFAVVADEIGKLAAASAESSKSIAVTIRNVTERIGEASQMRDVTLSTFELIREKIRAVSVSVGSLAAEISQSQSGSRQMLALMRDLKENAEGINKEGIDLEGMMEQVQKTMHDVSKISHEVVSSIGEISRGLEEISSSVLEVSENAGNIGRIGMRLDGEASKFLLAPAAAGNAH